jgi:hypothetical protein
MKKEKIFLPECGVNASFEITELLDELEKRKTNFIIIGAMKATLKTHTKPHSLDYWLRELSIVKLKNTMQATKEVQNSIVNTGRFFLEKRRCPISSNYCNALVITK